MLESGGHRSSGAIPSAMVEHVENNRLARDAVLLLCYCYAACAIAFSPIALNTETAVLGRGTLEYIPPSPPEFSIPTGKNRINGIPHRHRDEEKRPILLLVLFKRHAPSPHALCNPGQVDIGHQKRGRARVAPRSWVTTASR